MFDFFEGNRVVAEFSAMAGLCGLGIGILAWCHQQIRLEKSSLIFWSRSQTLCAEEMNILKEVYCKAFWLKKSYTVGKKVNSQKNYCYFILNSPDKPMPAIKPYSSEAALIDHIRMELKQVAKFKGDP